MLMCFQELSLRSALLDKLGRLEAEATATLKHRPLPDGHWLSKLRLVLRDGSRLPADLLDSLGSLSIAP